MKKLKLSLLLLLGIGVLNMAYAQEKENPGKVEPKSTINATDKTPKKIVHENIDYYVIDGIWYGKFKNKYVLRQAPEGAILDFLPKNGEAVTLTGKQYYKCKGVFYAKTQDGKYEVARP